MKPLIMKKRQIFDLTKIAVIVTLTILVLFSESCTSPSGKTKHPDAFSQNEKLGRGVNIIGYDPVWRSRDQARFTEDHFRIIKEGGFSTVRINLHPFRHMDRDNNYKLPDSWFEVLDWAVENALANDLMVILDFHEYNAMADDPENKKEIFLSFWRQVAPRYKDMPSNVLFEILNEPNRQLTPELWNKFLAEALDIIRESNPVRTVIIGPGNWNQIPFLRELQLPENDRNIIATIHYYSPHHFTHQGARWAGAESESWVGTTWGSDEEKAAVRADFQKAKDWSMANNRPILLGEFGAYERADIDSRVRYTSFVARTAEELGFSWTYWQFDSDFIVYNIDEGMWNEPIYRALIPTDK
jgi:endoglucanase